MWQLWLYQNEWIFFLMIIAIVLTLIGQLKMQNTFNKWSAVVGSNELTGASLALKMLSDNGINDVSITAVRGNLTDHYNPTTKTLALSTNVYNSNSVAALAVAAHEVGHAIQHHNKETVFSLRGNMAPGVAKASQISWILIFLGIIFGSTPILIWIGILFFIATIVFQVVTLPVEFGASNKALNYLKQTNILGNNMAGAHSCLKAAAMTYVIATAVSVINLFRLILIAREG